MPTFFVAAAAGAALIASLLPHASGPSAGPAPSTVWIEGRTLYFSAADRTVNDVSVESYPGVTAYVLIRDAAGTPIRPADPCVALASNLVWCPFGGIDWVTTVLRGEDDQFKGGTGKDRIYGGPGDDLLLGGSGNDLLYGQTGDDEIDGGTGIDYGDGGPDSVADDIEKDLCSAGTETKVDCK
jgi:hemolysin type calcium-binding protein